MTNQEFSWTGKYVGTLDGGKDLSADSFFTKTDYTMTTGLLVGHYNIKSCQEAYELLLFIRNRLLMTGFGFFLPVIRFRPCLHPD